MNTSSRYAKWIYLALLSFIWGSSFILIKKGLTGFGFMEAASIRMMAAGAVFLPWGIGNFRKIPASKWRYVLCVALFSMFVPGFLFCLAQQHIQSAVAGILNSLVPVFTFVLSILLYRQTYKINHVAGLLLGLASAVVLIIERSGGTFTLNIYAGLIVAATICYALNINILRQHLGEIPVFALSSVTVSIAGLLAFVLVFLPRYENFAITPQRWMPLAALVTLGIFSTAIAQIFYYKLIRDTSALFASSSTYLMPIVAVFWGLLDGEAFHWVYVLSIAGILSAVVLIRSNNLGGSFFDKN